MVKKTHHKSKLGLWKKGTAIFLSLVLSFVVSIAFGQVPPLGSNSNNSGVTDTTGSKVTKSVSLDGKDKHITVGTLDNVNLTISGDVQNIVKPIDIVVVLDYTKSMDSPAPANSKCISDNEDGTKLDCVKKSFKVLLDLFIVNNNNRTPDNELRLGLVTFNANFENADRADCADPTGGVNIWNLTKQTSSLLTANFPDGIKNVGTCWGTNTGRAMQRAAEIFDHEKTADSTRFANSKKVAILMTDGELNVGFDPTSNNALTPFKTNNVSIYTIGFGLANNPGEVVVDGKPPLTLANDEAFNNYLWCAGSAANLVTKVINGQTIKYCLAKDNVGSSPHGLRLNALPLETGGEYYYGETASDLMSAFQSIFNSVVKLKGAIEVTEIFDSNFSYDSLSRIEGPNGALEPVNNSAGLDGPNKYYLDKNPNGGSVRFLISMGTVGEKDTLTVNFNLKANTATNGADACIERTGTSFVKWGQLDTSGSGSIVDRPWFEQNLDERCYIINNAGSANQGDVYLQKNLDVNASVVVTGDNAVSATGDWATLPNYTFKPRTQSQKDRFYNELLGIADYLAKEKGDEVNGPVVYLESGGEINAVAQAGKLVIAKASVSVIGGNGASKPVGIIVLGGDINFKGSNSFNGVAIALPNGQGGGNIGFGGVNSFAIRGSLVAQNLILGNTSLSLEQFDRNNYLNNIPGLAPILDKIYSFYSF